MAMDAPTLAGLAVTISIAIFMRQIWARENVAVHPGGTLP